MSKPYQREIITKVMAVFCKCDKCGKEVRCDIPQDIPVIYTADGEDYCCSCQKKYSVGWHKK